jgi:hypothetical protein
MKEKENNNSNNNTSLTQLDATFRTSASSLVADTAATAN